MNLATPTDFEVHLFHEGNLFKAHELFGAHSSVRNGVCGTVFTVWAPHALEVRVAGDFNHWDGSNHKLERVNDQGIWSAFIQDIKEGDLYKYEIITRKNEKILKSDPFAFYAEVKPNTASIVYDLGDYEWNDQKWQKKKRQKEIYNRPMYIYELNLCSWKKKEDGSLYTYLELADVLIPYVLDHGFTHIELLPIIEHPYDRSWGYQGTGYYAATSRYGTPHELMKFIDLCHQNNLGVIMDWVPGHFCKDAHGLYYFDGEPTFEYERYEDRENEVWGTANFDLGKPEVQSFLISNALFWLEKYHIDGFRVDAVANMLYWQNTEEPHENPFAVNFLRKLNENVFAYDPGVLMIAEDSTDFPLVTSPTSEGGLGFNYKWNMGWMNDILKYMEAPPEQRKHLHHKVSFSLIYAFTENFILPLSHDEVVHGKRSLLNKMPGDYWQKFAQYRLLLGYMMTHPGKKLLFMGGEFAQFDEWKDLEQLDWVLDDFDMHQKSRTYFKELMAVYKRQRPLYEQDHSQEGFEWIDVNNSDQSIFSFIRRGLKPNEQLVVVCNFTPQTYHEYKVGVPADTKYIEIMNSDDTVFGGSGQVNKKDLKAQEGTLHNQPYHISMTIPPYGISILRAVKKREETINHGEKKVRRNVIGRRKG
ncbi:1,4-alpha-glucan branching enzyme [Peribacillus frigoritolerans]|uniref:1,4-alpha-glucan branching enzyme n=1 Tax=Peribacillus frigoritolerans TaxID=450367 RepID=UPI001059B4F4|nr:1,4-alpha-glucan branching enzyme [Peribacillus frigoritolerans]TDL76361.1 1,4-alpha-glucan branching enzyme [Peribacillus frigoritolerans]